MDLNKQFIAFMTIVRREIIRMLRLSTEVFLPAVITTSLYFLIFGTLIGKRIGDLHDIPYSLFIAPGLIMMSVITNSYGNVATSLFSARFQKHIEELLVSPISTGLILFGYLTGGLLRGFIVALLVFLVATFFVPIHIQHLGMTLLIIFLVSAIFSLVGFTNALFSKTFDDIMLIPTFFLTPFTYLGGIFYSITMLPPFWQKVCHFNPIWYMINAMRYAMIGYTETNIGFSVLVIALLFLGLLGFDLVLMKKGVGLKE